jgi:hypothetical protein
MVKNFTLLLFIFLFQNSKAQNLKGQWKGVFYDKSTSFGNYAGDKCEYVLELDLTDKKISGTSYTYFTDNGKRCYTICKVEGTFDNKRKYAEITETERTKTNIPADVSNCLQVHRLTYFMQGDNETLEGNWVPAPYQKGNCGIGTTFLTKRSLINTYPSAFSKNNKKIESSITPITVNKKTTPIKDLKPKENIKKNETLAVQEKESTEIGIVGLGDFDANIDENPESDDNFKKLEKRKNTLLKKIQVENKTIKVDLYDNGDIDGDSVSLFYNSKLLLSKKRLTDKAISFNLNIEEESDSNDLIMYAENLGTIPPNTALMVVTDGKNRYEIRITSDLEKSGKIQFVKKRSN